MQKFYLLLFLIIASFYILKGQGCLNENPLSKILTYNVYDDNNYRESFSIKPIKKYGSTIFVWKECESGDEIYLGWEDQSPYSKDCITLKSFSDDLILEFCDCKETCAGYSFVNVRMIENEIQFEGILDKNCDICK